MTTKIGLIQISCTDDKNQNIERVRRAVAEAADRGAKIVCLPELFYYKYFPQNLDMKHFELAEPVPGPTVDTMSKLAAEKGIYIIAPIFECERSRIFYNTAVVIDPSGDIVGRYRKNHIPHNDGYQEKYYFRPGDLGYPVFDTPYGRIAVSICWDHWFLETQRIYSLKGTDIVFSPAALGHCNFPGSRIDAEYMKRWELMLRGQSIQNGIFLAVAMRTGIEEGIGFCGGSFVSDPMGNVIAKLEREEGVLIADVDTSLVRKWHTHQQFFRDRRPDTYGELIRKG